MRTTTTKNTNNQANAAITKNFSNTLFQSQQSEKINPVVTGAPANLTYDLSHLSIQPKLFVGAAGDRYEQEADRVADTVMRMPEPLRNNQTLQREVDDRDKDDEMIQRMPIPKISRLPVDNIQRACVSCDKEKDEKLQRKPASNGLTSLDTGIESRINTMRGRGQPLPESERNFFEPRFGRDLSSVRIHTDSEAADTAKSINARAFTLGNNIVLGQGEYQPGSSNSRRLLAHELTHVVQQNANTQFVQLQGENENPYLRYNQEIRTIREVWQEYFKQIRGTYEFGLKVVDLYQNNFSQAAIVYTLAFGQFESVVKAAVESAKFREQVTDIVLGLAVGTAVGLLASAIPAVGAFAALSLSNEIIVSVGSGILGDLIKTPLNSMLPKVSEDLNIPRDLLPSVYQISGYKRLVKLHRRLAQVGKLQGIVATNALLASRAETEIAARDPGGVTPILPNADLDVLISDLYASRSGFKLVSDALFSANSKLLALKEGIDSFSLGENPYRKLEQDIWILWLSGKSNDDSEVVDEDPIQERLSKINLINSDFYPLFSSPRLGVFVGSYLNDEEQVKVLNAARREANNIRRERRKFN